MRTFPVPLTDDELARLATMADERGTKVKTMFRAMAHVALGDIPSDTDRAIRTMVIAGLHDGQIGDRLRLPRGAVAKRRRRLGLPANRQYKATRQGGLFDEKGSRNGK